MFSLTKVARVTHARAWITGRACPRGLRRTRHPRASVDYRRSRSFLGLGLLSPTRERGLQVNNPGVPLAPTVTHARAWITGTLRFRQSHQHGHPRASVDYRNTTRPCSPATSSPTRERGLQVRVEQWSYSGSVTHARAWITGEWSYRRRPWCGHPRASVDYRAAAAAVPRLSMSPTRERGLQDSVARSGRRVEVTHARAWITGSHLPPADPHLRHPRASVDYR